LASRLSLVVPLEELAEQFAWHVQAETEAGWRGDVKAANKYVKKYAAAFKKLRAHGDAGRDALAVLFKHPRMDVRVTAAACLLRHRTAEAKAVLEEAAKGEGMVPFEAQQALQRWEEGTWALDPE
jgi:hypothetical protein